MATVSGTPGVGEVETVWLGDGCAVERDGVGVGVCVAGVRVAGVCVAGLAAAVRRGLLRDGVGVGEPGIGVGAPLWAGDRVADGCGDVVVVVAGAPEACDEELFDGPNSEKTTHAPKPKKTAAMRIRASSCIAPPPGHQSSRPI
jgi:hypothetical protein